MSVPTGPTGPAGTTPEDTRRRQVELLTELRDVEHWRRLLAARLDLAVAAVAAVDEPVVRDLPGVPVPAFGLRDLVGLPAAGRARHEAALLPRLRAAQRDLDAYAEALRATTRGATYDLLSRLDDHRELPPCPHLDRPAQGLAPVLPLRPRPPRRGRHRDGGPAGPGGAA